MTREPCRTTGCRRRPPASAALPLPGVAEPQRCYDFQRQGSGATFLSLHDVCSPLHMRRGGASTIRRLILLLAVGWVPPSVPPSGACLSLGSSIPAGSLNAAEGSTTPGLRLCSWTLTYLLTGSRARPWSPTGSGGHYRRGGTAWAMAHTKPTTSRAMAPVTTWACLPWATRRWSRVHRRTCAFQLMS
jgi:hypothetical protein